MFLLFSLSFWLGKIWFNLSYIDRQTQSALLVRMYRDGNSILPFRLLCDADKNVGLLYYVYLLGLSPTDLRTFFFAIL